MTEKLPEIADRIVAGVDNALRTLLLPAAGGGRSNPARHADDAAMSDNERRHAAGLMRVNQAGEVAAQGLYQGHALVTRDAVVRGQLEAAADEERDHLNWCTQRLRELDSNPSIFNGVWYSGAFALGALSGMASDRVGFGFIEETERQVVDHLTSHLGRLPPSDARSREILESMRDDEAHHGRAARSAGAADLPRAARGLMRRVASIMTRTAYRI